MAYLELVEAKRRLLSSELYTPESIPGDEGLLDLLQLLEMRVDEWVGTHLEPQDYEEQIWTDENGVARLTRFPVISVTKIERPIDVVPGYTVQPARQINTQAVWRQGVVLHCGASMINAALQVWYRAGYDPMPPMLPHIMFQLLSKTLDRSGLSGDLEFLDQPVRDATSISLPGGLSKSFGGGGGSGGTPSQLDRLLKPLAKYRVRYVL